MAKFKSERHHWWPECVSLHWADEHGGVNRLTPNGDLQRSSPRNFGAIGNGHMIKPGGDGVFWPEIDGCFEGEFQSADNNFPSIIELLKGLAHCKLPYGEAINKRILSVDIGEDIFSKILECVSSLAIRSPMFRERAVALAERIRGTIPEKERNVLIGENMRHSFRDFLKNNGKVGKIMVIFSPHKEFIFGDGFYSNLCPPAQYIGNVSMLSPITPYISVLYSNPSVYVAYPRVVTFVASESEVDRLNLVVQAYSRKEIFFRSDRPKLSAEFSCSKHLVFSDDRGIVDDLIFSIPGIYGRYR